MLRKVESGKWKVEPLIYPDPPFLNIIEHFKTIFLLEVLITVRLSQNVSSAFSLSILLKNFIANSCGSFLSPLLKFSSSLLFAMIKSVENK